MFDLLSIEIVNMLIKNECDSVPPFGYEFQIYTVFYNIQEFHRPAVMK